MGLLKPATNGTAYLKAGIMGFNGSGKTFTATHLAIGLAQKAGVKQVAFFDTEKGSDFMKPIVEKAGLELIVHKGRAFVDLISVMKEVENTGIPLIIDSITHIWRDLCDSYQAKMKKKSLTMYDWGILKGQWKQYTDLYVNGKAHYLMLGRAGYEYETVQNEDTGKNEMIKSGIKMRVEGETGFEPDLLMEMERFFDKDEKLINRCWIVKDRTNTLNGKYFDFPKFKDFEPFLKFLNIGGEHKGIDTQRTSEDAFDNPDWSYQERQKRKEIALESLQEAFVVSGMSGTSAEAVKKRTEVLIKIFGTSSKTAIENLKVEDLEDGLLKVKQTLGLLTQNEPPKTDLENQELK